MRRPISGLCVLPGPGGAQRGPAAGHQVCNQKRPTACVMPCKRSASGLSATLLSREQPKGKMLLVPRCTSGIADSSLLSASESLEKDLCLSVRTHAWQLLTCVSAFCRLCLGLFQSCIQCSLCTGCSHIMHDDAVSGSILMKVPLSCAQYMCLLSHLPTSWHAVQIFWRDCGLGWRWLTNPGI